MDQVFSVGEIYRAKCGARLKTIAMARDAMVKDGRRVVFINKDTFKGQASGEVWTSTIGSFGKLLTSVK